VLMSTIAASVGRMILVALAGAISISIVGGIAYFFARLMWSCRP
jgi:hypothetical protein